VFSSDADEVFPGFSTDVVVVLLEGNEEHVHVKGWEIDLVDVEVCYILCERGALRGGEDVGMGIDSPERHGCYLGCLWALQELVGALFESIKSCYDGEEILVHTSCVAVLLCSTLWSDE
jgi:hypothetical protein